MKDSDREFSHETSENEMAGSEGDEISEQEPRKTVHDHPFSIDSILNGRTKRRKPRMAKNVEENRELEENALPLNALEAFTSKAFSTMKPERIRDKDEGMLLVLFYCFGAYSVFCMRRKCVI